MRVFDDNNVALCAIVVASMQFGFFVIICQLRLTRIIDLAGGLSFTVVALVSLCVAKVRSQCVISALSVRYQCVLTVILSCS